MKNEKAKYKTNPTQILLGKISLRVFKSMKQQSEVNIFKISSCMNIEQIKNIEKWTKIKK